MTSCRHEHFFISLVRNLFRILWKNACINLHEVASLLKGKALKIKDFLANFVEFLISDFVGCDVRLKLFVVDQLFLCETTS